MNDIKIDIYPFDLENYKIIKDHGCWILLTEDRMRFRYKVTVEELKDHEDKFSGWERRNQIHTGFIFKDRISSMSVQSWDTLLPYKSFDLVFDAIGCDSLKMPFQKIADAERALEIVDAWLSS